MDDAQHLTAQQAQHRHEEAQHEAQLTLVRRQSKWIYLTKEDVDSNSPSRKDGLDPVKEARWRRECAHLIQRAGMTLKVPQWAIAGAQLLCHRFFARKSMKANCRFSIATACLHLAAKMEESPRSIRDVVRECERIRHVKDKDFHKKLNDPIYLEEAKEHILVAERAVLYTLGFDLNIAHPYTFLLQQLSALDLLNANTQQDSPFRHLMQNAWNIINDSFRTTLCLQFTPDKLAFAALYLANELNKREQSRGIEEVISNKAGPDADFFTYFKISKRELEAICHQVLSLYEEAKLGIVPRPNVQPDAGLKRKVEPGEQAGTPAKEIRMDH